MAEYEQQEGDNNISTGVRYYIPSLGSDAEQFGNAFWTDRKFVPLQKNMLRQILQQSVIRHSSEENEISLRKWK